MVVYEYYEVMGFLMQVIFDEVQNVFFDGEVELDNLVKWMFYEDCDKGLKVVIVMQDFLDFDYMFIK